MRTSTSYRKEIDVFGIKDLILETQLLLDFRCGRQKMYNLITDYLLIMFIAVLRNECWAIPSKWGKGKCWLLLRINRKTKVYSSEYKKLAEDYKKCLLKLSKIKNSFNEEIFFDFNSDHIKNVVFKASEYFTKILYHLVSKEDMSYIYEKK
jgi:hypothetical protein